MQYDFHHNGLLPGVVMRWRYGIYDFEAYRDIHGYDFKSATKDFYAARLYLDYHF